MCECYHRCRDKGNGGGEAEVVSLLVSARIILILVDLNAMVLG